MFISKTAITKTAALLAYMMVSALSVKAADDECKLFKHVSNKSGEYYENQYFKFRLLKGTKIAEHSSHYVIDEYMAIFPPLAWQEFVDDRVGAFYENTQNKFLANPPKELSPSLSRI